MSVAGKAFGQARRTAFRSRFLPTVQQYLAALLALHAIGAAPLHAAPAVDLYGASAELPGGSRSNLSRAFDAALSKVLVKVTGRREAAAPDYRRALFSDASRLVQQYRMEDPRTVWADFDGEAIRSGLDASGQPVWGSDRPAVLVWMAVDAGGGDRTIIAAEPQSSTIRGGVPESDENEGPDAVRTVLEQSAADRGLPLVLPLVDAEDLSRLSFADLWGGFIDPVLDASDRYAADAVLIGRSGSASAEFTRVRWTLITRDEQIAWTGSVAEGPNGAADELAQRLATYANSAGRIRVQVRGMNSPTDYGAVSSYLRSIGIVERFDVVWVWDDTAEFDLVVRGDTTRFRQSVAGSRILSPATGDNSPGVAFGRRPDLFYAFVGGP